MVTAAGQLLELDDAARAEIWASGAFGLWREPGSADPAEIDRAFLAYLGAHPGPVAAALATAAVALGDPELSRRARATADGMGDIDGPPCRRWVGTARATTAWQVRWRRAGGCSVVLEYRHDDGSSHCLLAELDGDRLVDISFGPAAEELLAATSAPGDGLEVTPCPVTEARDLVVAGWEEALSRPPEEVADGFLANHLVAAARLGVQPRVPRPEITDEDPDEGTGAADDAIALAVLESALRRELLEQPPPELAGDLERFAREVAELVSPPAWRHLPRADRRAVHSLESADWLGAVIESVREGVGAPMSGEQLVSRVNRCPEVTTTIPASEREWFAWAWELVADRLDQLGVVAHGRLTELGWWVLPRAMSLAWQPAGPHGARRSTDQ